MDVYKILYRFSNWLESLALFALLGSLLAIGSKVATGKCGLMSVSGCSQLNQLVGGDLLTIMVIMHLLVRGSIYCAQYSACNTM